MRVSRCCTVCPVVGGHCEIQNYLIFILPRQAMDVPAPKLSKAMLDGVLCRNVLFVDGVN